MSQHPLFDRARDPQVRKAAEFRAAATALTGDVLAADYRQEIASAPKRAEAGKKYFVEPSARLTGERRKGRDEEHMALALVRHCRETGPALPLPAGGTLDLYHALTPLQEGGSDRAKRAADSSVDVGRIDAFGVGPDDRMAIVKMKYLSPEATRGGTGDTPLRALLEGLGACAIASANRDALQAELNVAGGPTLSDAAPMLVVLASPRYWELSRKREAQRGAAWIKQIERLAEEIGTEIGITVLFLAAKLSGDPGWEYVDGAPKLSHAPQILASWEPSAGRVRPKPRPRPRGGADAGPELVEADLSRAVRSYAITESYTAGDRIEHHTLGTGVVQGVAGPGKIHVLFGEQRSLLVHERPSPAA